MNKKSVYVLFALLVVGICVGFNSCAGNSSKTLDVLAEIDIPKDIVHGTLDALRLSCSADCKDILVEHQAPPNQVADMRVVPLREKDQDKWNRRLFAIRDADSVTSKSWDLTAAQLKEKEDHPDTPTGLVVSVPEGADFQGYIDMAWEPNKHPVAGYNIYCSHQENGPNSKINDAPFPGTKARILNVKPGPNYFWSVSAVTNEKPMDLSKIEIPNMRWRDTYYIWAVLSRGPDGKLNITRQPQKDGRWVVDGRVVSETGERYINRMQSAPLPETARIVKTHDAFKFYEPGGQELNDLRALQPKEGVRFENSYGTPVFPGVDLMTFVHHGMWPGNEGLFAFYKNQKIEVSHHLNRFEYDPVKQRVISQGWLFDLDTKTRRELPVFVEKSYVKFFLIPGHDLLMRQRHYNVDDDEEKDYTDWAGDLEVCNLKGESIAALSMQKSRQPVDIYPFTIAASKDLIAYTLDLNGHIIIRVHAIQGLNPTN